MDAKKLSMMANQIAEFFAAEPDHAVAVESVASHLKRFWEPRMRREILAALDAGKTDGMHALVVEALRTHRVTLEPIPR